ncbi:allophanate hydrolase [Methylobacterium platani]|uniref:Allophanate hydrolase n=2 Tax=Methylobacterium platani TaxID=427683 RepID=A0A179S9G8_9HYPH|nr:allophanate hydrolase [Methylobacterium platani]KMO17765.1 allophanate hydrolase [Methylobacterium platani JCM 14648]OAS24362.1 allophanate hydrolase [Methylobacterium platani]
MTGFPLTLAQYREAYASGSLTPAAAVHEVYRRIAAHADPAVFITLRPEAEVAAEALDLPAGPLHGIPVAVKDNIAVAGLPTTCACPDYACVATEDAAVVARLRRAGALVIGKTNLDQFATGLVGVRSPYGVPRNALAPALVPGGSSSGSAVAVAAGLVPLALGTDTAGSGRVPAGLNNIVGLKPTLGALSTRGVVPACRTLDCVSVFALTVEDAFAGFAALAGFDPDDPFSRPVAVGRPGPLTLRVGVPDAASRRFAGDALSEAAFEAALADLGALGAALVPVDLTPFFAAAALLYDGPWVAERWEAIRALITTRPEALHPATRAITERATAFSAADAFAGRYRLAELRRATETVWQSIDALCVPTFPRPQTLEALAADPIGPNAELGTYTNFVNLLDLCALAVPSHPRADGGPAGVTLIAPAGRDAALVPLGDGLHRAGGTPMGATGALLPQAPETDPERAAGDEIELAVVGAHLSGLPLNGELTSLGARRLRAVATTPDYRLFALPGAGPRRPGLVRVAAGAGTAIATEVWALAPDAFGRFVAAIPAPLGIGTLRLADGTSPKGFLCEAEGVREAKDVSTHGGWRAYLAAGRAG